MVLLLNESFPSGSANVIVESGVYSAAIRCGAVVGLQVSYRNPPVYHFPFFFFTTATRPKGLVAPDLQLIGVKGAREPFPKNSTPRYRQNTLGVIGVVMIE